MRLNRRALLIPALLISALALATSPSAFGQGAHKAAAGGPKEAGLAEEILRLDREYDQAYARLSAEALGRLQADDFRMTARGRVTTKAELLARLADGGPSRGVIESLTADDVIVRLYGDSAVTTGRWKRVSKDAEGKDTSAEGHFTRVWVRRGDRWLLAVAHYSPVAAPPKRQ
jgi:ketosteroid isomerase-like protein